MATTVQKQVLINARALIADPARRTRGELVVHRGGPVGRMVRSMRLELRRLWPGDGAYLLKFRIQIAILGTDP